MEDHSKDDIMSKSTQNGCRKKTNDEAKEFAKAAFERAKNILKAKKIAQNKEIKNTESFSNLNIVHEGSKEYYQHNLYNTIYSSIHEEVKNLKCDECCKTFSSASYLQLHKVHIHEGVENYKCDTCGKAFTQSGNLTTHIRSVHEGVKRVQKYKGIKCKTCGKTFGQSASLKIHISTVHEGVKDFKCETCGKAFGQSGNLKMHIRSVHIHEGVKNYKGIKNHKCEKCDKAFCNSSYLRLHISSVHEGVKDFKCETCGKAFSHSGNLNHHIRSVHEGVKDFKCETCGKAFSQSANLKTHIICVHKGINDYKRETRGKPFSEALILLRNNYETNVAKKQTEYPMLNVNPLRIFRKSNEYAETDAHLPMPIKDIPFEIENDLYIKPEIKHELKKEAAETDDFLNVNENSSVNYDIKSKITKGLNMKKDILDNFSTEIGNSTINAEIPEEGKNRFYCQYSDSFNSMTIYCGKAFIDQNELKAHIKDVHESRKMYECYTCNKSFGSSMDLNVHECDLYSENTTINVNSTNCDNFDSQQN